MKLSFAFLACFLRETVGYSSGAPPYTKVLQELRPGGPHTNTYQTKDKYSYDHHHIRLDIVSNNDGTAKVYFQTFLRERFRKRF